jgi:two-component system nitrogen regulation sensor histidine kinase NtrY
MERRIRLVAIGVVAIGIFFGILLSAWAGARVTRPMLEIAQGAKQVSAGEWGTRVGRRGPREFRKLADAFNEMTEHLTDQREKLLQNERVAAWREVAHRLGQELHTTIASLENTAESLERLSREAAPETNETIQATAPAMRSEIEKLKLVAARFSDFAKSPELHFQAVDLNEIVRDVVREFQGQFSAVGRPPISSELHLEEGLPPIQGDSALLHRGIENLILNAMDAMPSGGVLMLRTTHEDGEVELEVSDTGKGLSPEESSRLFSTEDIARKYGSELTLATVESVVADHGGRIRTESESGVGTSFHIHLPRNAAEHRAKHSAEYSAENAAEQPAQPSAASATEDNHGTPSEQIHHGA